MTGNDEKGFVNNNGGYDVMMAISRREFVGEAFAACAMPLAGCVRSTGGGRSVKFLLMTDHHVESDFMEGGRPAYTMWKAGNHAALAKTYEFISSDPYCRDIDFAFFCGDQLNTGYLNQQDKLEEERANYYRTLESLELYRNTKGKDVSDLDFRSPESFFISGDLPKGYAQKPIPLKKPDSRVIAIQGNHDTAVEDFYRECSFKCGDTRFITFFASYVGLPAPKGQYRSTARISDDAVAFVEREMSAAAADPSIRHIVLASHWTVVHGDQNFKWPIFDACKENGFSDNRRRILAIAEKYGCDLFINGHEHNPEYPVGKAGPMSVINCGSVAAPASRDAHEDESGTFAIVEINDSRAVFNVYSRAIAKKGANGEIHYAQLPSRRFTREIVLKPVTHNM